MSESPIELRGKGGGVVFQGTQKPPGGGSQPVNVATLKIADADIKALPTTELELVAAPGPGKMLWPIAATLICDTTEAAYSNINSGAQISVGYAKVGMVNYLADGPLAWLDDSAGGNGSVSALITTQAVAQASLGPVTTPTDIFGAATDTSHGWVRGDDLQPWEDQALVIGAQNADGDFQDGDALNSLLVVVLYAVVDLTP